MKPNPTLDDYYVLSEAETTAQGITRRIWEVEVQTETAMANEVRCKVLAHNICCLIQSMHEFSIDLDLQPLG